MFLLKQLTHRMLIQYHQYIGCLYVPHLKARIHNENGGYYVVTNSLGFRSDIEFRKERGHRPRLLFFGDSYTAGENCENSDRFPEKVGEMLDVEVYNYGLSGSGTDQHLLIYEHYAREVEADLIVLCVQVDSVRRIQVSHRESIDRTTGRTVLVPKPYFLLEKDELVLHNVPVPRERPEAGLMAVNTQAGHGSYQQEWMNSLVNQYRTDPRMEKVRWVVRSRMQRLQSEVYRLSRMQPYNDYRSAESPGWQLMEAIIRRFIDQVDPLNILLVPIPTYEFFRHAAKPIYQPLFNRLEDPQRGVAVLDISTPLSRLSWKKRQQLAFRFDNHFSPLGHQQIAEFITEKIKSLKFLPQYTSRESIFITNISKPIKKGQKKQPLYILGLSCFYHNSAACLISGRWFFPIAHRNLCR